MYANDPLILAVMLADRRADLQRDAARSRTANTWPRTWFRRLDVAALRRRRPDGALDTSVEPESGPVPQLQREATGATRTAPAAEPMSVEMPSNHDHEARELVSVAR